MGARPQSGVRTEGNERFRRSKLTLRFLNPVEEDAFNRGRTQKMFGNLSTMLLILSAIVLPSFVVRLLDVPSEWRRSGDFGILIQFSSLFLLVAMGPLLAVLLRVPRIQGCIQFHWCEIFVAALMVAIAVREALHLPIEYLALGLDAVVTGVHIALPIRWYFVLWIDVLFVIGLTARWALLDFEPIGGENPIGHLYVVCTFAGLVLASSLGLRSKELTERSIFATVVDERTLRARAEFDLEQAVQQSSDTNRPTDSTTNTGTSLHQSSASTELLFQRMGEDAGVVSTVLRDLGEQEQWLVDQDTLKIFPMRVLGRGGFGLVVEGLYYSAPVAVKLFASKSNAMHEHEAVMNELRVLRRLKHPNVVVFYGASLYTSPLDERIDIRLVFEHVKGKSLKDFATWMHGGRTLPLNGKQIASCLCVMKDVMRAVIYLHDRSPPVVHSDLKPTNIMTQRPWTAPTAKLLDFGLSRVVSRRSKILGGTSGFKAPETLKGSPVHASPPVDIFAVGRILVYLASGQSPGKRSSSGSSRGSVSSRASVRSSTGLKAETCAILPEGWRAMVDACTRANPCKRPTATELYPMMFEGSSFSVTSLAAGSDEDDGFPLDSVWLQTVDPLRGEPLHAIHEASEPRSHEPLSL